jgi:nitrite reductase (NADH) small subunit
MPDWTPLAKVSDCPPGTGLELVAGDRIVALFNIAGQFFALDGVCPHQGGPLGKGLLAGCVLTCPWHGWQFDVRTGVSLLNARIAQERFALRVEGEQILIELP